VWDEILDKFYGTGAQFGASVYQGMYQLVQLIAKYTDADAAVIAAIYNLILPAGVSLLICMTLYDILTQAIKLGDNMTPRMFVTPILKCLMCFIFLMNAGKFIGLLLGVSNALVDSNLFSAPTSSLVVGQTDDELSFLAKIFLMIFAGLVGNIVGLFAQIVIAVNILVTKVEIIIRFSLLPLAVASICGHEHHGGIAYIKKMIASAFFMFAVLGEIYLVSSIADSMLFTASGQSAASVFEFIMEYLLMAVVGPFVCCSAVSTTKQAIERAFN